MTDPAAKPGAPPGAPTQAGPWPALAAARAAAAGARVPLWTVHRRRAWCAGSVARQHLPLLSAWPQALQVDDHGVTLRPPAAGRTAFLALANQALHEAGAIVAWRRETYPLLALPPDGTAPDPARHLLATMERAAARFWGSATFGAHCNGYVAGPDGRPSHLWIARRAFDKPTDPGLLDNLVGGGVPHGQRPADTVVREGWEEAGLSPAQMTGLACGRVLRLARDLPEGFQLEWLSVYDLALPPGLTPVNQDGEVHSLHCLPVQQALQHAASGDMTVDASLATLDFALRHGLLPPDSAATLQVALAPLLAGWAQPASTGAGSGAARGRSSGRLRSN